jgi:two-component system NtrC family sensor kinase
MTPPARILLVEDSAAQAARLTQFLEAQGWEVIHKLTAEEALSQLAGVYPDLMLVDYSLPYMTGDEFCRQVRMRIDTRIIPIIMLTAQDALDLETRGLESGADDFVRKSANPEHLILRIRTMLRRVRNASSVLRPVAFESSRSRVLAVDDSATYLAFLQDKLYGELYQLETSSSPAEGLKRIERGNIDCVLVDLVMPGLDGIEVCRQIDGWRRNRSCRTMILMLTAKEDTHDLEQALEAGADDFVGKSSDVVVIKVRIRALLRRKFYEDENERILEELKKRELDTERARMAQESAESRAALFDQLRKTAAELLRSNAELEEFAYAASHDLRAPLHGIGNLADWLCEELSESLSEEQRKRFDLIHSRVHRLQSLVDDLLQYSRAGRPDGAPAPVETGPLVKEIADLLDPPPSFTIQVPADMPVVVSAVSPIRLVFSNLIGNALKHHNRRDGLIEVIAEDAGLCYRFSVRDDGPGIAPKFHDRIFGLFQTLSSRDCKEGSGLGLALVKRIVEKQGGKVEVDSDLGRGATFSFTWPKHAPAIDETSWSSGLPALCAADREILKLIQGAVDGKPE